MANCKQCNAGFEVTDYDRRFYAKFGMPDPKMCPDCRAQRRWSFRNQDKLYKRKCDLTGEDMVSLYSPDKPYKVYKESAWWSDTWDSLSYGRDFDFSRPFSGQFNELCLAVPRRGMHQDGTNENCEYTTFGLANKNCYLSYAGFYCEDVYYSTWVGMTKDAMDCLVCFEDCQQIYECTDCKNCYLCFYCRDCRKCQESLLLDNCRNCKKCIACKNLRGKEYHIYNKPVSKDEFETFKKGLLEGGLREEKRKFNEWKLTLPTLYAHLDQTEDCSGDYLEHTKNCHNCFDIFLGAQDCRNCQFSGWKGKDMMDCSMAGKESELLYQMHATTTAQHCAVVNFCRGSGNIYYSDCVSESHDCFGCTGLRHKEYCVLNKKYSKEEYEVLVPRIVEHMEHTGEWGEFFPQELSPFGYNETIANQFFPLAKEEALKKGFKWSYYSPLPPEGRKTIPANRLPDKISDVPDDILNWAIECEATEKLFKIIPQELQFYRKHGLPVPHLHPDERGRLRFKERNPHKLWTRRCTQCQSPLQTSYSPERPEIIYCEECYLKEVY